MNLFIRKFIIDILTSGYQHDLELSICHRRSTVFRTNFSGSEIYITACLISCAVKWAQKQAGKKSVSEVGPHLRGGKREIHAGGGFLFYFFSIRGFVKINYKTKQLLSNFQFRSPKFRQQLLAEMENRVAYKKMCTRQALISFPVQVRPADP